MDFYNKTDLVYKDYKWSAYPSDDPKITGKPDSTFFSRCEGWEMLYLINSLSNEWSLVNKSSGTKIEKMVRGHLPSTTRSQENVKKWIRENWETY